MYNKVQEGVNSQLTFPVTLKGWLLCKNVYKPDKDKEK